MNGSASHVVLVTGCTGNVGRELVPLLQKAQASVRLAVRQLETAPSLFSGTSEVVAFDFLNGSTFAGAFQGVDSIFLVRPPALGDPQRQIFPALRAARSAGVRHVVFLSILGVDRMRMTPHYKIELEILRLGFQGTFLRAGFFMQNLSGVHRDEIRNDAEIFVPAGRGRTSFIDCRDIAEAAAVTLLDERLRGQPYALTGPEALDYYEVARILSTQLGKPVRYRAPSAVAYLRRVVARGYPLGFALVSTVIYATTRMGMAASVTGGVQQILGRPPRTLSQFVRDYRHQWL